MELQTDDLSFSPGTIILGGTPYLISKGTDATAMAFLDWVLKQVKETSSPLKDVMKDLKDIPKEYHAEILREATRIQASGGVSEAALARTMLTPEAAAYLLFLLSREHHPDTKYEQFLDLVQKDSYLRIYEEIDKVSGLMTLMHKMKDR